MSTNELEVQPVEAVEEEYTQDPLNYEPPKTKSGVRNAETVALQNARFSKGDYVHMSLIENGSRVKGVFTVRRVRYNPGGWVDYELTESLTGKPYRHSAGVRENLLKAGK